MGLLSSQHILLCFFLLLLSLQENRGHAITAPVVMIPSVDKVFPPLAVLQRLPSAILLTTKASLEAFIQTAGVMVPAGLIWKLGTLKSGGFKPWVMEGGK